MQISNKLINIFLIAIFLFLCGCKPTEKGYKAAYDAALSKREAATNTEIEVENRLGNVQRIGDPVLKNIDGKEVYILNKRIRPADSESPLPGNYNVAIGKYKMITNCRSQSADLKEQGYNSFPAQTTGDEFYTIAGSFDNLAEAIEFYEKYKNGKDKVYVGLPNSPVIIYSPK